MTTQNKQKPMMNDGTVIEIDMVLQIDFEVMRNSLWKGTIVKVLQVWPKEVRCKILSQAPPGYKDGDKTYFSPRHLKKLSTGGVLVDYLRRLVRVSGK